MVLPLRKAMNCFMASCRPMGLTVKTSLAEGNWLPDMDLNHDKQIQSLLCYRYTIGQERGMKCNDFFGGVKLCRKNTGSF